MEIFRAGPEHIPLLAGFYRGVWDPSATADGVRAARARAAELDPAWPGMETPIVLAVSGGRAIAHIGTVPLRVWDGTAERPAHWTKGLMVLPEYRNGPVGFGVVRELVADLRCALAMVVQPAAWKLFLACGFTMVGTMENRLRLLNPGRVLQELDLQALALPGLPRWMPRAMRLAQAAHAMAPLGWGIGAGARLATLRAPRGRGLRVDLCRQLDEAQVDSLWQRARRGIGACAVRDGAYVRWRYGAGGGEPCHLVSVHDGDRLVAFGALREPQAGSDPRLKGMRVASLLDALFDPARAEHAHALLGAAEAWARARDADALLCSATHAALRSAMAERAYVRVPGTVNVLVRTAPGERAIAVPLDRWWILRGDEDAHASS